MTNSIGSEFRVPDPSKKFTLLNTKCLVQSCNAKVKDSTELRRGGTIRGPVARIRISSKQGLDWNKF
jgi:hypothetical protein